MTRGVEIVEHGGYPELRVDGAPFFIHSAAFFYYRIPRDLWEPLLHRYRSLGINTLDIYIPWNWHEPKQGEFDFDGHTNPRRNLRALLMLIAQEHFRLIARPGPEILNEWRYGGYPGWLLERPEYKMNPVDWFEGRYPPLDNLNVQDAEAAARGWLDNRTHIEQTRVWLARVAKELAPYSSHRAGPSASDDPDAVSREASGPLLFVQLGDDFAIGRTNNAGPDFWRYVEELRGMLESGGLDVPVFINPRDMRVTAAGSALDRPIGAMGQWYMPQSEDSEPTPLLTARDAGDIEFFSQELKTQPHFPPVMIEFQAGGYAPADDDHPPSSLPENTLLSSRLLIANGVHGINYFPLQDTFTPAGYSVPWANRSYRWEAALGPDGNLRQESRAILRNQWLLKRWGQQLAASHQRADFGIVDPLGAYPQALVSAQDILRVSQSVMRVERLATLTTLSSELLDPEYQPVEQFLRNPLVLLPVVDPDQPQFHLSDKAQDLLVEYVRHGGTLVVFPVRPAGEILERLWESAPTFPRSAPDAVIRGRWKFGDGEVIESSKDWLSWIALERSLRENRVESEADWATGALRELVTAADVRPSIWISGKPKGVSELVVSEIVSNEGTGLLGERKSGQAFLSVTNLAADGPADTTLQVLSPAASTRGAGEDYIPFHVIVPPHESLLLPVQAPICFDSLANALCEDRVVSAGGEFLGARREGKVLKLLFYVPAQAEVRLHLREHPVRATLEQTFRPEAAWDDAKKELQITIPRGIAPDFLRTLEIALPYVPHVPEEETASKAAKPTAKDLEFHVGNAVRLPVGENEYLGSKPALIVPDADQNVSIVVLGENSHPFESRSVGVSLGKPLHGSATFVIPPHGTASAAISLKFADVQAADNPVSSDGLFHDSVEIHAGHDRLTLPVVFLVHSTGGTDHYRFDFDRDGADEWVLENDTLRLIVSPESGGQAIALMEKSFGTNLTTSVGLLRDSFSYAENSPGTNLLRMRGRYGLLNRPYEAQWQSEKTNPALKLSYVAPDVFPAGATIEKTVQFDAADTLRVDYRVALHPSATMPGVTMNPTRQSFVAVNSFPATARPGPPTRFCWPVAASTDNRAIAPKPQGAENVSEHCEDFMPNGKTIELPAGTMRVAVHALDRTGMAIEWECRGACAQMRIEQKSFSALFRLEFPPESPGADAAHYTLRIHALDLP